MPRRIKLPEVAPDFDEKIKTTLELRRFCHDGRARDVPDGSNPSYEAMQWGRNAHETTEERSLSLRERQEIQKVLSTKGETPAPRRFCMEPCRQSAPHSAC